MTSAMKKRTNTLLRIATIQGLLIGVYHIILPYQWNWHAYTSELPPMIEWSLYALNFFFSILLILLSLVAYKQARQEADKPGAPLSLIACLSFWAIDTVYQIMVTVPAPPAYSFIKPLFLGAAVLNLLLYVGILVDLKKSD